VKHYGDIKSLNGDELPAVDVVVGGSPCQDLSLAALDRAGLSGERSSLFLEQIRVVSEMRKRDKATGRSGVFVRPRYMVWENVAGARTSPGKDKSGEDFAEVIT
jgi:DNA (cytosine-5)-methyltransferase 1